MTEVISQPAVVSSPLKQFVEEDEVDVKRHAGQRPLALRHTLVTALMDGVLKGNTQKLKSQTKL